MLETSKGALDTRSLAINVHEFDWSKVNNVIYEENGCGDPHHSGHPPRRFCQFYLGVEGHEARIFGRHVGKPVVDRTCKGADIAIHESFLPNDYFVTRYKFQPGEAIYVSTLVHTTAEVFGKIMALTEPKHAVAYHFQNDPDTLPAVVTAVRLNYDGPVDFAVDGMVWNVTKEGVRTRVAVLNTQPYPPPSVVERQQEAPGGEKYETPEWVMQGYEWETLPVMDKVHEDFNQKFGTDFKFPLKPKE